VSFDIWTIYVATVLALMSTPGPSHLLMLSNSASHGFRRSLATAAGDLVANALQMLAAGLGLAVVVSVSGYGLSIIKWLGVCYLLWLGVKMIRNANPDRRAAGENSLPPSLKALWLQGFLTSAANPKAVVFFAALFPQFIQAQTAFWPQFLILSATYILIDGLFLSAYGSGANWIASKFKGDTKVWIERTGGGFMIFAAVLLSIKTISNR
jgi:homoserine/homoserine lactone efflux protein